MKKMIVAVTMVMMTLGGMAQKPAGTTTVYPRLGLNYTTVSGEELYMSDSNTSQKAKRKLGVLAGIEVEKQLAKGFAVSGGMLYSMQGFRYENSDETNGDTRSVFKDHSQRLHYINVPVLAVFNGGLQGFSLKAGVQVGYLIGSRWEVTLQEYSRQDGSWHQTFDKTEDADTKWMYHKFDVSFPVGVGYEFNRFAVDLRYNIPLTNINKIEGMNAARNQVLQLTVGYAL